MTHFASVVLVDARGWVLLQERDERPRIDPDTWGLTGGHVEADETVRTAAHRELEEETGIRLEAGVLRFWQTFRPWSAEPEHAVHVWVGRVDLTDDDVECHEGRQIVFVEPAAALRLHLGESASQILPRLLDSDLYRELAP